MQHPLDQESTGPAGRDGMGRCRVLIASDHSIVRRGLKLMLGAATSHVLIEGDRPVRDVAQMVAVHAPDVVIADLSTGTDGAAALNRVFCDPAARSRLLILGPSCPAPGADLAAWPDATGSDDVTGLLDALHRLTTHAGHPVSLPGAVLSGPEWAARAPGSVHVTPREREVMELITQGLCSKRIARALNISVTTVRTHRQRLMSKLGLRNSVEVAQYVTREFGEGGRGHDLAPAVAHAG